MREAPPPGPSAACGRSTPPAVRLVIGPVTSKELRALKPYADEYGLLRVMTGSTAAGLAPYLHGERVSHPAPIRRGDGLIDETRAAVGSGTIRSGCPLRPGFVETPISLFSGSISTASIYPAVHT